MVSAFVEELRSVTSSIEENPLRYPKVLGKVRRALMTRFSYAIYFTIEQDLIIVLAVTHQARNEDAWKKRM